LEKNNEYVGCGALQNHRQREELGKKTVSLFRENQEIVGKKTRFWISRETNKQREYDYEPKI